MTTAVVLSIGKLSAGVICTDVGMGMMATVLPESGPAAESLAAS